MPVAKNPVPKSPGQRHVSGPTLRRDLADDYARRSRVAAVAAEAETEHYVVPKRFGGLRFRLKGGVPRSLAGKVFAGGVALCAFVAVAATVWEARALLLHDSRLVLASSSAVEISGNRHLTRAQLLSVFGEDVDRNLLTLPLDTRRAELESLPWVEHATVMRLLPDRVRIDVVERTPVAFVRQGSRIGLIDANGVLLDMDPHDARDGDAAAARPERYSFPVVMGLGVDEPPTTRAARMHLFARFTSALDADGSISKTLNEVDLSSPEDVKVLLPNGTGEVLVHLGEDDFLNRYRKFEANLPGWRTQYPRLASVDMRYERQVVLEMAPGSAVPVNTVDPGPAPVPAKAVAARKLPVRAARAGTPAASKAASKFAAASAHHLTQAFPVPASRHGGHP